jgi:hypothetical protein
MLVNLRAVLARVVDIVLLRAGPETLPASKGLLAVVIAVNVAVSAAVTTVMPTAPQSWPLQLLVGTIVTVLWFQLAFALANKPERFLQTATAIFATTTLFLPALIPLVTALLPYLDKPDPAVDPPAALSILCALLAIWLLIVQVRIVRAAFEWPYFAAIIFIFGLNFASALVYGVLFGVPSGSA